LRPTGLFVIIGLGMYLLRMTAREFCVPSENHDFGNIIP
jgi:hypothetical protein